MPEPPRSDRAPPAQPPERTAGAGEPVRARPKTIPSQLSPLPAELDRCLDEPGYTPPTRALETLLDALIALPEAQVKPVERALARAGAAAVRSGVALLAAREASARPRLLGVLVRLAGERKDPALYAALLGALDEPLVQSRKLAARGLGKLGESRAEPRLLAALESAGVVERKSIVDALGALGGEASAARLSALASDDVDLCRRRERARLLIERRLRRSDGGSVVLHAPLRARWQVALFCRTGLAPVLADELGGRWQPRIVAPNRVDVEHAGSLGELLDARTALEVALVVSLPKTGEELAPASARADGTCDAPERRIADALARPECLAALGAWTEGVPRFRVSWTTGGHRRALTWALARALRERTHLLTNDSHAASWTLHAPPDARGELLLVPRVTPDPRFAYRRAEVPAASHPTLAAALARLAGVQPDEVVWDPFVGSGLELVERARLGPVRELWGSDIDPRALAAARTNLDAAGLGFARLVAANALEFAPPSPSLILSNPPMGRRVARDGSVGELLERFVERAARVLRPSGRLVWLSPQARRTEAAARRLGLDVVAGPDVDLGGFTAQVQICTRIC